MFKHDYTKTMMMKLFMSRPDGKGGTVTECDFDRADDILRQADALFRRALREANLYDQVWQAFAALLPVRSVGVVGDVRTYGETVVLRAVEAQDGMTADWARLPYDLLDRVARSICNEIPGVSRVVYDITGKPPATIEWE